MRFLPWGLSHHVPKVAWSGSSGYTKGYSITSRSSRYAPKMRPRLKRCTYFTRGATSCQWLFTISSKMLENLVPKIIADPSADIVAVRIHICIQRSVVHVRFAPSLKVSCGLSRRALRQNRSHLFTCFLHWFQSRRKVEQREYQETNQHTSCAKAGLVLSRTNKPWSNGDAYRGSRPSARPPRESGVYCRSAQPSCPTRSGLRFQIESVAQQIRILAFRSSRSSTAPNAISASTRPILPDTQSAVNMLFKSFREICTNLKAKADPWAISLGARPAGALRKIRVMYLLVSSVGSTG